MFWPLLFACHGTDLPADPTTDPIATVDELAAPGPYRVGHRQTEVNYVDPMGASRTLRTSVWWPTEATTGAQSTYWNGAVPAGAGVFEEAPIATGSFPLAVFSHGHQGYAENSSFLMEHLATHGWIVAAPDHTGNTTLDGGDRVTAIYYQRPADISAVNDFMDGLDDSVGAAIDRSGRIPTV